MKEIFVLFNHLDNQRYTFLKKKLRAKESWLEAEKLMILMVLFTLRFTPFKWYTYGKRC